MLMSHQPGTQREQAAIVSAEHMLDQMGERIGSLAARSGQRLQQFTTSMHARGVPQVDKLQVVQQRDQVTTAQPSEAQQLPLEKAEAALDTMQQRISLVATVVDLQFRRTTARIREGAEDILAEAQDIRHMSRK
ncbi:hypothetical protein ccbrp13_40190 [Ktedonobacteria bacterium brp13]|nr:hypothetical protein ccbrp13_40190 [Ktedonobacteria bacterium brp13]